MENFDPSNPEYKKVEDLPEKEQVNYRNLPNGGFITKEAAELQRTLEEDALKQNSNRGFIKRFLGGKGVEAIDLAHDIANDDNVVFDEKQRKTEGRESKIKERLEQLGITLKETYETLSEEEQELTGIKRIRRKEVIGGPSDLFTEPKKYLEIYNFLTDGLFPSYKTWNHVLGGDGGGTGVSRFNQEGQYTQEMLPLDCILNRSGMYSLTQSPFFQIKDGEVDYVSPSKDAEQIKKSCLVYPMCFGTGGTLWRDDHTAPFFVFGNRNKRFREYVEAIQTNPQMREMLSLSDWHLNLDVVLEDYTTESGEKIKRPRLKEPEPIISHTPEFVSRVIPYLEKVANEMPDFKASALDKASHVAIEIADYPKALELFEKNFENKGNYPRKYAAAMALLVGDKEKAKKYYLEHFEVETEYKSDMPNPFDSEWEESLRDLCQRTLKIYRERDKPLALPRHDISRLNYLTQGVPVGEFDTSIKLPVVRHPELRPLRWCHSDAAVMEKDGRVNILFFETD